MGLRAAASRRAWLGLMVGGAGGAAMRKLAWSAEARQKLSQAQARYQNAPNGQQRCGICLQFRPSDACNLVEGPIGPTGWCQFFAARDDAH